jgi:hypothetical protein
MERAVTIQYVHPESTSLSNGENNGDNVRLVDPILPYHPRNTYPLWLQNSLFDDVRVHNYNDCTLTEAARGDCSEVHSADIGNMVRLDFHKVFVDGPNGCYGRTDLGTNIAGVIDAKYGQIGPGCNIQPGIFKCFDLSAGGITTGNNDLLDHVIIGRDSSLGDNVQMRYVILGKDVVVDDNCILSGTKDKPLYIPDGTHVKVKNFVLENVCADACGSPKHPIRQQRVFTSRTAKV